jgi:YbbR domain-containing protein
MKPTDLTTWLLAMALAIFLWGYARMSQEAREITRPLRAVPVTMVGKAAAGIAPRLHYKDHALNLNITGPSELVTGIQVSDVKIEAVVDSITGPKMVKARVVLPDGVRLVGRPPRVRIQTVQLEQANYRVRVAFITAPPPGTTVGDYLIEPTTVTVEGPEAALERVKYVTVAIDPTESFTARDRVPQPVDASGQLVEGVQVLASTVQVRTKSLTGLQITRVIAVKEPTLTSPPRQLSVRVARRTPEEVTVVGEAALLERLGGYLPTDPIDVRTIRKDTTRTVHLRVPPGLNVVGGTEVRVDLVVQPL